LSDNIKKDNIRAVEFDIAKLSEMTRKELYNFARQYNISNYSKMTKNELMFSILRKQTESIGYFFY
jgi:transcription termination factor Rho